MSEFVEVQVNEGILRGYKSKNEMQDNAEYYSFQGIPYAKPPIGHLRFKAPQPSEPWNGILDATKESKQSYSREMMTNQKVGSEDCLYLNVYTNKLPNESNILKPVMFFIHGGSFTSGSNQRFLYNPEYLLCEDVVLVIINYRLGLLGFLSLDDPKYEIHGNAGFKDMVLALKWVKNNIKSFNGDPNNVTIFGESAGATSVHLLVLSSLAKGLFHKAIIQSGSVLCPWTMSRKVSSDLANILQINSDDEQILYEKLNSLTVEEIHSLQEKLNDGFDPSELRPYGWTIEKPNKEAFLTRHPLEIMKSGQYNHVPIIFGYTNREGMLIDIIGTFNVEKYVQSVESRVPHFLGIKKGTEESKKLTEKIKRFYYEDLEPSRERVDHLYKEYSDNLFVRDIYRSALIHSESSPIPVYLYKITLETNLNVFKKARQIQSPGVSHGDDIAYLFKTILNCELETGTPEYVGVKRFCRLWANFAKFGDPTKSSDDPILSVNWKPFKGTEKNFLVIGKSLENRVNPNKKRMNFWMNILQEHSNTNSKL